MPDINEIRDLIELAFSRSLSRPILQLLVLSLFVWLIMQLVIQGKDFWNNIITPLMLSQTAKRQGKLRRIFAKHLLSEVERLNRQEAWSDYRFSELEAEIEADATWKRNRFGSLRVPLKREIRRVKSLSAAIETSVDKMILVEGDPGSGKSVALRHIAHTMLSKAADPKIHKSVIPIYINLRELVRTPHSPIDRALIERFVLHSLRRVNDRDIDEFLEAEFSEGLVNGTWLFLFDSFDELPDVLSSTEEDDLVRSYSDALTDFMHGMNMCRCVIASRYFRSPEATLFRHFRILPLTEERKRSLIRKYALPASVERDLIAKLNNSGGDVRNMCRNPMFLSLLCAHISSGKSFPQNSYTVMENYIASRLERDKERLRTRYNIEINVIQKTAAEIAFAMLIDKNLGLSPRRDEISNALQRQGIVSEVPVDIVIEALEYTKVGRKVENEETSLTSHFSFSHRRIQEYFATTIILKEPDRIPMRQLLSDGRWRESAVVLFQTQPPEKISSLLAAVRKFLHNSLRKLPKKIEYENIFNSSLTPEPDLTRPIPAPFPWPKHSLHLLSILQDGFLGRFGDLPADIRKLLSSMLLSAQVYGTSLDKKWALEVAAPCSQVTLLYLIRETLNGKSLLLYDVIYRQVAHLETITPDVARWIRTAVIDLAALNQVSKEEHTIRMHLSRLSQPERFLSVLNLLIWWPRIGWLLHCLLGIVILTSPVRDPFIIPINETPIIGSVISANWFIYLCSLSSLVLSASLFSYAILIRGENSFDDFLATFIPRLIILFLPWLFLDIPSPTLIAFVSIYLALWPGLALIACKEGKYTEPYWWPFLGIALIPYGLRNKQKITDGGIGFLGNNPGCLVRLISAIIIGIGMGLYEFMNSIPYLKPVAQMASDAFVIVMAIGFLIIALISPYILWLIIKEVTPNIKEWFRWLKWKRTDVQPFDAPSLFLLMNYFNSRQYIEMAFERIMQNDLIVADVVMEQFLTDIVIWQEVVEVGKTEDGVTPLNSYFASQLVHSLSSREFQEWTTKISINVTDNATRLLEVVRKRLEKM